MSLVDAVGDTPLVHLRKLSDLCGADVYVKLESLNPGGSIKDRAAAFIIRGAMDRGQLQPGGVVVEATGGNTGIALAMLCASLGLRCHLFAPDSISLEKVEAMKRFGAILTLCPASAAFDTPEHYFQRARSHAETEGHLFANQFDNPDNGEAHAKTTGPEMWRQSGGFDGFACAAGTGGTISGVSRFLRGSEDERARNAVVAIVDPPGSSLRSLVLTGELSASEGTTIAEGIGIGRVTRNFAEAKVDACATCSDREIVEMTYWLLREEGISAGPSAALNVVGAVKLGLHLSSVTAEKKKKQGMDGGDGGRPRVVTVVCDAAERYASKVLSGAWLGSKGLAVRGPGDGRSGLWFLEDTEVVFAEGKQGNE